MAKNKTAKKPSIFKRMGRFLKDVRGEMKKVHWPTPKQLRNNTAVVLVMMVAMGVFVGLVDLGMGALTKLLLSI